MLYPATAILSDDAFQDSETKAEEIVLVLPFTLVVVVVDFNAARSEAGAVGETESALKQDTPSPHGKPFHISSPVM
ncbi:hypothetical protein ABD07_13785 [Nitrosomonas oligotropha]|nr:hypothetical protein [Nitrosomonas oligotropha]